MVVTVILKDLRDLLAQLRKLVEDLDTEDPSMTSALLPIVRPADSADAATTPVTSATVVATSEVLGLT